MLVVAGVGLALLAAAAAAANSLIRAHVSGRVRVRSETVRTVGTRHSSVLAVVS